MIRTAPIRLLVMAVFLSGLLAYFPVPAAAADQTRTKTKGIPANPAKKKLKGIPANPKTDASELTDEEKALIAEIAKKAPSEPAAPRQKVELPKHVRAARPPVVPQTAAPRAPQLPLGDPNVLLVHIPQPPKKISPPVTKAEPPTADPTKKKK